jgi:hypothetical protein
MQSNPLLDPFVEAGYRGYTIRATAHRQEYNIFRPSVTVRSTHMECPEVFFEFTSQHSFVGADQALGWAMSRGREAVDSAVKIESRISQESTFHEHSH